MSKTPTAHIHLNERGIAWIDETKVTVIEVASAVLARLGQTDVSLQRYMDVDVPLIGVVEQIPDTAWHL
jgi:hypothetical protein